MALSQIHRNDVKHWHSKREDEKSVFSFSLFTLNLTFLVDASKFVRLKECKKRVYPKYTWKHRCEYIFSNV